MLDTCVVERLDTSATPDPMTGAVPRLTVYEGRCKVGGDRPYENAQNAGGAFAVVQRYTVHLPATAGPFDDGDLVTITAASMQPHLVGREFRLAGSDERSWQTSQRIFVDVRP